jgi:hypothetical protein
MQSPLNISRKHISCTNQNGDVGFEVLTPLIMQNNIFWNITTFITLEINGPFGKTYLILQVRSTITGKNPEELDGRTLPGDMLVQNIR